jgi:hypothetical protein
VNDSQIDNLGEPVWRIAKWADTFERAESRKLKTLTWIAMPVGFSSTGYQALLEEFEEDAPAVYGAWCALCSFAAICHVRGTLGNSRGNPLKLSHLARVTGFPVNIFARLVAWASRTDIGWLEPVSAAELSRELAKTTENRSESKASGECPDDPPSSQVNPPSTRPNRTEPNRTGPNPTEQNQTADRSIDTSDWHERTNGGLFLDRVFETAYSLHKACKGKIDRETIWQVAWVGEVLDRQSVLDKISQIREGKAHSPKGFLGHGMVKLCHEHGEEWDRLKLLVPPPPPPPPSAVTVAETAGAM